MSKSRRQQRMIVYGAVSVKGLGPERSYHTMERAFLSSCLHLYRRYRTVPRRKDWFVIESRTLGDGLRYAIRLTSGSKMARILNAASQLGLHYICAPISVIAPKMGLRIHHRPRIWVKRIGRSRIPTSLATKLAYKL